MAHQKSFAQPALPSWVAKVVWSVIIVIVLIVAILITVAFHVAGSSEPSDKEATLALPLVGPGEDFDLAVGEFRFRVEAGTTTPCMRLPPTMNKIGAGVMSGSPEIWVNCKDGKGTPLSENDPGQGINSVRAVNNGSTEAVLWTNTEASEGFRKALLAKATASTATPAVPAADTGPEKALPVHRQSTQKQGDLNVRIRPPEPKQPCPPSYPGGPIWLNCVAD
jgi:hypothetical protein